MTARSLKSFCDHRPYSLAKSEAPTDNYWVPK